ncbi:MAG: hypothetical protein LBP70_00170 [Mycoplasmataceae bacterium]|nr:hypothetical protein [Mycoplasmataceae bacterium]
MGDRVKPEKIMDDAKRERWRFLLFSPAGILLIIISCVWFPHSTLFLTTFMIIGILLGVVLIFLGPYLFWYWVHRQAKNDIARYREEQRIKFEKEDADKERRDAHIY